MNFLIVTLRRIIKSRYAISHQTQLDFFDRQALLLALNSNIFVLKLVKECKEELAKIGRLTRVVFT